MKNARYGLSAAVMMIAFLLSSCGAEPTPTPQWIVEPATIPPPTEVPPLMPTPTLAPVEISGPQIGAEMVWQDGSTMAYVPAGSFTMGDGYFAFSHEVSLDGYWIQQTKVTNRMYEQCVKAGACTAPTQELGGPVFSNPEYVNHPIVGVNWDQAQAYCTWIQGSLPTEAQWEKAARGTDGRVYPWGSSDPACGVLNYAYCYKSTTSVESFAATGASPYGLLDMAGNTFEWVADWYDENYYSTSPLDNPTGPPTGQYRGVRGSSFETDDAWIASTIRRYNEPGDSERDTSFRCVTTNPQPFAPYCQLAAFIPSTTIRPAACELPEGFVTDQYCGKDETYAKVQISFDSTWQVRGTRLSCTEVIDGGLRQLTCAGPETIESTNEIILCNDACSNRPSAAGESPVCSSGYTLDPATGMCNYSPILPQPGVAGCPSGYSLVDRGGEQTCGIAQDVNGNCPIGLYMDVTAGMCVPPNGETLAPYGIDHGGLAAQTYAGCTAGYSYRESFQCCQAITGGSYPGCSPGSTYDAVQRACLPDAPDLSGEGCTTVRVTTLKCSEPVNTCENYNDSESRCLANLCSWNDAESKCVMQTSTPGHK